MDKIEPTALKSLGRVLLPMALTKSGNYGWMYATVCISPTIEKAVAKIEGSVIGGDGKVRKKTLGKRKTLNGGFVLWAGSWELFDLPAGTYTLELKALDKEGKVVTSRRDIFLHEKGRSDAAGRRARSCRESREAAAGQRRGPKGKEQHQGVS